jgi:hypothetical protein
MNRDVVAADLTEALSAIPIYDAHTHLTGGRLGATGLHDILLYHMVVSELYSSGCPSGARLTEFPGWPTDEEAHLRIVEALPYLPRIRNTSCWWGVRTILRDLYGWTEPVDADTWRRLDGAIRERAEDRTWQREVMHRAGIEGFGTELARRGVGADDDVLRYALEWAFFTRTQRGEYDTALYELERCWGVAPGSPVPHGAAGRPPTERVIRSLDDVHGALDHFVRQVGQSPVVALATHVSTDIEFRPVSDSEMTAALSRRGVASREERDTYASYVNEALLTALGRLDRRVVYQFSFGAEPLPHETASLVPQRAIADLATIVAQHPDVSFVCLVSSRHANQSLSTLCRELPNLALAGYWWHNFFPAAVRHVIDERLDMLPINRQIGFFSDAYALEWAYAKVVIVRAQLAEVLAGRILQGQYTRDEAVDIARTILYQTPHELLDPGTLAVGS